MGLIFYEVAILQSYRSGSHVKLNFEGHAQYMAILRICDSSDESFRFCLGESFSTYSDLQTKTY